MALTRQEKEVIVSKITESLKKSKSAVFSNFAGLKVDAAEKLRKSARKSQSEMFIAKKTLLKIALKNVGLTEVPVDSFDNGVATIFSYGDEIAAPKLAAAFAKENKALNLLGGFLMEKPAGERALSLEQVKALAALPTKHELLAKLVGTLNAPVSGFVNVLAGNLRGLVNVLNGVKDAKSKV